MAKLVYFNGVLVPQEEVAIPITDRSFLYGEGLFETIHATRGFIPFMEEHLDRFFSSLAILDFNPDISRDKLRFMIYQTLRHNRLKEAYLRVHLSRENEELGSLQPSERYNLLIFPKELEEPLEALSESGAAAVIYSQMTFCPNPLSRLKTTSYLPYLRAKNFAQSQGAKEAILLSPSGYVVEGASSNVFMWTGVEWLTPKLEQGGLAGVTRRVILDLMRGNEIPVQELSLSQEVLIGAEEIFVSNAIQEVLPITLFEGRPVGAGNVGSETRRIEELFREEIQYRYENYEIQHWDTEE